MEPTTLANRLTIELPHELRLIVHHLLTPPTPCPAIFAPPPNQEPDRTSCESHFLSVSIDHDGSRIQVFALEVFIYTTNNLTTVFVSKADSTGYLHLLKLPRDQPSPLRTVIWIFLSHLIWSKQRVGIKLVLSLFARAQDQYLFPGSIENDQKHVLDDRGLIRWWCKILDRLLRESSMESSAAPTIRDGEDGYQANQPKGYLKVPGCDLHETKSFLPDGVRRGQQEYQRWAVEDPFRILGKSQNVPERCLIPRFPDDPKARFVIDLDDELPENQIQAQESASKIQSSSGKWRSVQSIEEFWEMMAFRQECAAGRLVGFIWGVFNPVALDQLYIEPTKTLHSPTKSGVSAVTSSTPLNSQSQETLPVSISLPSSSNQTEPSLSLPPPPSSPIQPSNDSQKNPPIFSFNPAPFPAPSSSPSSTNLTSSTNPSPQQSNPLPPKNSPFPSSPNPPNPSSTAHSA